MTFSPPPGGIRYSYLLLCENGSILPLIAINDLPPTVTVLPPLDVVNGITLVQEILRPPLSSSLGAPETDFVAGTGKAKAAVVTTEEETACSSVFQASSSSTTSSVPSVVGRIRDAVQTRILSPPPGGLREPTSALSSESGMLYIPPHSKGLAATPGSAAHARLPAPTRESLAHVFKPCPTYLSSGSCLWGATCNDPRLSTTSDINDDVSEEDSAASTTSSLSKESGDSTGKKKEKLKSTEPCAYFRRKVGCKRGKDCFFAHGKDGSTSTAGDRHVPIQRPTLTASNKLEGKWRLPEPQSPSAEGKKKEVAKEVAIDKKVSVTPPLLLSLFYTTFSHGP